MDKILVLIAQRRVWAAILGGVTFIVEFFHFSLHFDVPVLTDLLTNLGGALATLITAALALWSYTHPKTPQQPQV